MDIAIYVVCLFAVAAAGYGIFGAVMCNGHPTWRRAGWVLFLVSFAAMHMFVGYEILRKHWDIAPPREAVLLLILVVKTAFLWLIVLTHEDTVYVRGLGDRNCGRGESDG